MGAKPPTGGAAPKLPSPPQQPAAAPGTGKGAVSARRRGQSRNRTQLTQGLGSTGEGYTTPKKGLLGE